MNKKLKKHGYIWDGGSTAEELLKQYTDQWKSILYRK